MHDLQFGKVTKTPAAMSWNGPRWLSWAFRLAERCGWLSIKHLVGPPAPVRLHIGPEVMPEVAEVIQNRILDVLPWMKGCLLVPKIDKP